MRDQRGFALIAVLLVMAMVGVLGAEFAYSMRREAASVRAYKDRLIAGHLAEAAVEQAIREIAGDVAFVTEGEDGELTFYRRDLQALKRLPRKDVPLGAGAFSYRITDEEARLNVNTSPPARLERLLIALDVDKIVRDTVLDSIQDWRDGNDDHRLNGAESDDTYLERPVPHRAKNGNLDSLAELLQINGITRALYEGNPEDKRAGLAEVLTVRSPGQVNLNTATPVVLQALGLSEAEITEIRLARRELPYQNVGRFGGRSLIVTTRTFRVDAEGVVDGKVKARVTAIVQKRASSRGETVAVVEWSGIR